MAPQNAAGDDIAIRARRLIYRAAHRGTRELDMLLGPFAAAQAGRMSAPELAAFERLLEEPETDLQAWLLGQAGVADTHAALIARILDFKRTSLSS
jgi:antitoxin CptB